MKVVFGIGFSLAWASRRLVVAKKDDIGQRKLQDTPCFSLSYLESDAVVKFKDLAGCDGRLLERHWIAGLISMAGPDCKHGDARDEILYLYKQNNNNNSAAGQVLYEDALDWFSVQCEERIFRESCIGGVETLELADVAQCGERFLIDMVHEIKGFTTQCNHNAETEVRLLCRDANCTGPGISVYGTDGPVYEEAIAWLVEQCEETIVYESCLGGVSSVDLVDIPECGERYLEDAVGGLIHIKANSCPHSQEMEVRVWYRDAHGNDALPTFEVAIAWLDGLCNSQMVPKSCIEGGVASLSLADAAECGASFLGNLVQHKKELSTDCRHDRETEVRLLCRDANCSGPEISAYGKDGPAYGDAFAWLVAQCEEAIVHESCLGGLASVDFVNIPDCGERYLEDLVEGMLDSQVSSCPHDEELEVSIWYRDATGNGTLPAFNVAIAWLDGVCKSQMVRKSCIEGGVASLPLADAAQCDANFLRNMVSLMRDFSTDCRHDRETEVRLLCRDANCTGPGISSPYGKEGPEYDEAIAWLVERCEEEIVHESCIGGLANLDLGNSPNCGENYLEDMIWDRLRYSVSSCPHDARMEAKILYRDAHGNGTLPTFDVALAWLDGLCESQIVRQSCIEGGVDALGLSDVVSCEPGFLRNLVWDTAKVSVKCHHGQETEVRLLCRDANCSVPANSSFDQNGPAYEDAVAWLAAKCEEEIVYKSCIGGVETLDLANIATCGNGYLEGVVSGIRTAVGCAHGTETEVRVLYRDAHGNDALPTFDVAIEWLNSLCESQIVRRSCIGGFDEIVFEEVGSCSTRTLERKVDDLIRGTNCKHRVETEIQVLFYGEGGVVPPNATADDAALQWLRDECHKVNGCAVSNSGGLTHDECYYESVVNKIEERLAEDCPHDIHKELEILTGETNSSAIETYINDRCAAAWEEVDDTTFTDVDYRFSATFMELYAAGYTFLNSETGNFQGPPNPGYPVDKASEEAGWNISSFYNADPNGARNSMLSATYDDGSVFDPFSSCQSNAFMCCFGRDRQSDDNNGNCNTPNNGGCEPDVANPADNTNLCYFEDPDDDTCTAYVRETEGDAHCHGFVWSNDPNDAISQLKINNFFYVSLYDHLYSRGYVEPFDRKQGPNGTVEFKAPMCHCIEEMPTVSRSDCTQIDATFRIKLEHDPVTHKLIVVVRDDDDNRAPLSLRFNQCRGYDPDSCDANGENCTNENNDLASYAFKLWKYGKLDLAKLEAIFEKLAGHNEPNRNQNEPACVAAYCADPDCADDVNDPYTCNRRRRLGAASSAETTSGSSFLFGSNNK